MKKLRKCESEICAGCALPDAGFLVDDVLEDVEFDDVGVDAQEFGEGEELFGVHDCAFAAETSEDLKKGVELILFEWELLHIS